MNKSPYAENGRVLQWDWETKHTERISSLLQGSVQWQIKIRPEQTSWVTRSNTNALTQCSTSPACSWQIPVLQSTARQGWESLGSGWPSEVPHPSKVAVQCWHRLWRVPVLELRTGELELQFCSVYEPYGRTSTHEHFKLFCNHTQHFCTRSIPWEVGLLPQHSDKTCPTWSHHLRECYSYRQFSNSYYLSRTVTLSCVCTVGSMENKGKLQWKESSTSLRTGIRSEWRKVRSEEHHVRKVTEVREENFLASAYEPTLKQYPRSSPPLEEWFLFLLALQI